jgi:short-subunit dehydrogenase
MAGMVSPPGMEPYCATKFAVVAMSEGWAGQLAAQNIGVSILCPGFVKTRIHESRRNRQDSYGPESKEAPAEFAASPVLSGIPVGPVAKRVVEGIKANDLYIFTHPEFRGAVQMRFARIMAGFDAADASEALKELPARELNVPTLP